MSAVGCSMVAEGKPAHTVARAFDAGLPVQMTRNSIFAVDDLPELEYVRKHERTQALTYTKMAKNLQ